MEDCGPEPSIEGDLRREAAGERGTQGRGRPPRGFTSISLWGRGAEKHASLGPEQTHAASPPPSLGPSDSSFPPLNTPQGCDAAASIGSGLAWEPVPAVKFPGYSMAKTTAPGEPHLLPQLAGDDSPTRARGAGDLSLWGRE